MYGTQAVQQVISTYRWFENDVKMYGTQAAVVLYTYGLGFENDVKMYGTQAYTVELSEPYSLRMM